MNQLIHQQSVFTLLMYMWYQDEQSVFAFCNKPGTWDNIYIYEWINQSIENGCVYNDKILHNVQYIHVWHEIVSFNSPIVTWV